MGYGEGGEEAFGEEDTETEVAGGEGTN